MSNRTLLVGASFILATMGAAHAQVVRFEVLDQSGSASDMSPDGQFVVGFHASGGGYRWSRADGYVLLGGNSAVAVSDDGSVVLGEADDPMTGNSEAAIWREEKGTWEILPAAPENDGCPYFQSPYELSGDGTAATGLGWEGCSGRGFLWREGVGTIALESLANGNCRSSAISGDGTLMGGFAQGSFNRTPAIWTADGNGQLLDPPNGDIVGEVFGISDDGTTIVGLWDGKAFRLDEGEPIELFDTVIGSWDGIAMDIADDGTIVGFDTFQLSRIAWVRLNGTSQGINLRNHLEGLGATGMPSTLDVSTRVSTSGHIIIGHNFFANGWMVNMCVPDIDGGGDVGFNDLLEVLASWGTCSGYCPQDLDLDGEVGFNDLLIVLSSWGDCP